MANEPNIGSNPPLDEENKDLRKEAQGLWQQIKIFVSEPILSTVAFASKYLKRILSQLDKYLIFSLFIHFLRNSSLGL